MNTQVRPQITTYPVGPRASTDRLNVAAALAVLLTGSAMGLAVYDRQAGDPTPTLGRIVEQAHEHAVIPSARAVITQGEHAGREVRTTGADGLVADTAVWLGVTVGPLSGDVFAQDARTADDSSKTTRKPKP